MTAGSFPPAYCLSCHMLVTSWQQLYVKVKLDFPDALKHHQDKSDCYKQKSWNAVEGSEKNLPPWRIFIMLLRMTGQNSMQCVFYSQYLSYRTNWFPSIEDCIKKMCYAYTEEFFSHKEQCHVTCRTIDSLEMLILNTLGLICGSQIIYIYIE